MDYVSFKIMKHIATYVSVNQVMLDKTAKLIFQNAHLIHVKIMELVLNSLHQIFNVTALLALMERYAKIKSMYANSYLLVKTAVVVNRQLGSIHANALLATRDLIATN